MLMKYRLYLIAAVLQHSLTLAQYAPLLSPSEAIIANGTLTGDEKSAHICRDWNKLGMPVTDDCLYALAKIPRDPTRKPFHSGDGGLPKEFTNGKCEVKVFFKRPIPTGPEESSWLDITISATQLMSACIKGSTSETRTGGEMKLSEESKIWIEIRKPFRLGDESASNKTIEDVDMAVAGNLGSWQTSR